MSTYSDNVDLTARSTNTTVAPSAPHNRRPRSDLSDQNRFYPLPRALATRNTKSVLVAREKFQRFAFIGAKAVPSQANGRGESIRLDVKAFVSISLKCTLRLVHQHVHAFKYLLAISAEDFPFNLLLIAGYPSSSIVRKVANRNFYEMFVSIISNIFYN